MKERSKAAHEKEDRAIFELETKRNSLMRMLEESKKRELGYYERAKQFTL